MTGTMLQPHRQMDRGLPVLDASHGGRGKAKKAHPFLVLFYGRSPASHTMHVIAHGKESYDLSCVQGRCDEWFSFRPALCPARNSVFRGKCRMNFHATHKTLSHRSRFGFLGSVLQAYSCLVMSFFFLTGSQLSNTFLPLFLSRGARIQ